MELEEMKNIWKDLEENQKIIPNQISEVFHLEYKKQSNIFKMGEIFGLVVAYTFAGFVLYKFNILDVWYLRVSGCFLIIYLLIMPLYTLFETRKMKHVELAQSNYKTVLEHIYATKTNLNKAEKISFLASPFLYFASIVIFTKLFIGKNFFTINMEMPIIFLIGIAFLCAILFNVWVFKKRDKQFKSLEQILDEEN